MKEIGNKPVVGISDNYGEEGWHNLKTDYVSAIAFAGAVPVIIPCTTDESVLAATLSRLDGIVLSGGGDVSHSKFGGEFSPYAGIPNEVRDDFDLLLYRLAKEMGVPVLGICRGIQVINIAEGGDIYQDLPHEVAPEMTRHSQTAPKWQGVHGLEIIEGTTLAQMIPDRNIEVNSFHHQAVKNIGKGLIVNAISDDGIVEGLESAEADVIAVQYHPERMVEQDGHQLAFMKAWVEHLRR